MKKKPTKGAIEFQSPFHEDRHWTHFKSNNSIDSVKKYFVESYGKKLWDKANKYFDEYYEKLLAVSRSDVKNYFAEYKKEIFSNYISTIIEELMFYSSMEWSDSQTGKVDNSKKTKDIRIESKFERIINNKFTFADYYVIGATNDVESLIKLKRTFNRTTELTRPEWNKDSEEEVFDEAIKLKSEKRSYITYRHREALNDASEKLGWKIPQKYLDKTMYDSDNDLKSTNKLLIKRYQKYKKI